MGGEEECLAHTNVQDFQYHLGDCDGFPRSAIVEFVSDPDATEFSVVASEPNVCQYVFEVTGNCDIPIVEAEYVCEDNNEAIASYNMGECPTVVQVLAGMGYDCESDL